MTERRKMWDSDLQIPVVPRKKYGAIELVVGPMFSGKSTELERLMRRMKAAKKQWLSLVYSKDNRYTEADEQMGSTHDGGRFAARKILSLEQISEKDLEGKHTIFIDEAQFFPKLSEHVHRWSRQGINVVVAALNGDFKRDPFPAITPLYALMTECKRLTAICTYCGGEAYYSKRLTQCQEVEEIGGADKYVAACGPCFDFY